MNLESENKLLLFLLLWTKNSQNFHWSTLWFCLVIPIKQLFAYTAKQLIFTTYKIESCSKLDIFLQLQMFFSVFVSNAQKHKFVFTKNQIFLY